MQPQSFSSTITWIIFKLWLLEDLVGIIMKPDDAICWNFEYDEFGLVKMYFS